MGKLNIFVISFSNFSAVYNAGDRVEGYVTIELTDQMSLRGVRLIFDGEAYVSWEEGSSDSRTTYTGREKYFHQEVLLYGVWPQQDDISRYTLAAGRHVFPFSFTLPYGLPSSFEVPFRSSQPYVHYSVAAKIDKAWKANHTCKRLFTVISTLDLNSDEKALLPVQGEDQKTICCLCCATGPITADFRIDHAGYVSGEPISLFANIRNNSNQIMEKSFVSLNMEIKIRDDSLKHDDTSTVEIDRIEQGPIAEGGSFSWEGQQFIVPPLPPSYMSSCTYIDIKYFLQLTVEPSGLSGDLKLPLEIVIGTVPLRQVMMQYPPPYPPTQASAPAGYQMPAGTTYPCMTATVLDPKGQPSAPTLQPAVPFMAPGSFSHLPPPSGYYRCVRLNTRREEDIQTKDGPLKYAPVYTYFNWGHSLYPFDSM